MQQFSRLIVTFLLNSVWQIALIWVVAGGCTWIAARVSARCQHSVWVAGLVLSIVVPVLGLVRSSVAPAVQDQAPVASTTVDSGHASSANDRVASDSSTRNVTGAILPLWAEILRPQERRIPLSAGIAILAAACYLLFLFSRLIRFWYAWKRAWEIAGSSTSSVIPPLLESAAERSRLAFGLSNIPILCSPTIDAPATLGIRQPLIILPEAFWDTADIATLTPVIGHEMAHIKRRDFALNLIYELLYLPISFHPAAALMKRRIAQTRELACDELVTERLLGPSEYARALVTVASRVTGAGRHSYTLGVFDADNLEERVMKLTDNKSRASVRVGRAILLSAALVLLATGAIASAYSLNAGPVATTDMTGVKQERIEKEKAEREKAEREKSLTEVVTKDGAVYAYRVEIPLELKPLIGTWKGSADYRPDNSEVSRTNPVRNPDVKLVHSD
ncbi:MAG: M56 family metallopeptidase, partial [Blastocatellia bacterium]